MQQKSEPGGRSSCSEEENDGGNIENQPECRTSPTPFEIRNLLINTSSSSSSIF